jgi:hypothetical protein
MILTQAMDADLATIHEAVVPLTPVGVTSMLRGSWQSVNMLPGEFMGVLGSPLVYAPVMEEGRTPGAKMPPPEALRAWVALKVGADVDPFVIARSIGRKGIKGKHMLREALAFALPRRKAIWDAAAGRLMEES